MYHLSIDIETFSSIDIKKCGMYRYAQAPDFEIMLLAYSWGQGVELIDLKLQPDHPYLETIRQALQDPQVVKHAYNSAFEWTCLNRAGFTTPIEQWRCTMAHGLYCGLPDGLGKVADAMGMQQDKKKLGVGMSLIRTFCVPRTPTKTDTRTRILPHHEPDRWRLFGEYCKQDVVAEMAVENMLAPWPMPEREQKLWQLDTRTNAHGVALDMPLVNGAILVGQQVAEGLTTEFHAITEGVNPKSVKQLTKWLEDETEDEIDNLRKDTVAEMLKTADDDKVRRVLEIRQQMSKTSTKKYDAMARTVCADGRARGVLRYYKANRTGRWGGAMIQPQNLPRNHMSTLDIARQIVRDGNLDGLRLMYSSIPDTLSQLIRTAIIPSPGNKLIVSDFSAIEARVIAWWAGESWRQEVFSTHGKIYEESASRMFGVPLDRIVKGNPEYDLRQKGKVAELALGFGGGVGALMAMGGEDMGLTEDEMENIKRLWRAASPRIRDLWYACENAALSAVRTGRSETVNGVTFGVEEANGLRFMTINLPTGRKLYYFNPQIAPGTYGNDALHYMNMNQQTNKWELTPTFGGKLVENCVQGIARDCLADTLLKLDAAGYQTVIHVHDEAVIDAPQEQKLEDVIALMSGSPPWAPGLLLGAAGFECEYYQKD